LMKNTDNWKPSKFIFKKGKLIASRDVREVSISSRLMADIVASFYKKYIPVYVRGNLIDLGCGNVPLYNVYREYIVDNVCVDWPNDNHQNSFVDKECDLNLLLPFDSGAFDSIIISDVLEHIHTPQLLWQEMARILKTDGYLLMNVPFYYWLHEEPHDYYRYTRYALEKFAAESGFQIMKLLPIGGIPEVLADLRCKLYIRIPFIGKFLSEFVRIRTKLFLYTSLGKRISGSTADKFPLGYFVVAKKTVINNQNELK
jgi:SAM-dependent methyltransferase